jgi:hypothetical protein
MEFWRIIGKTLGWVRDGSFPPCIDPYTMMDIDEVRAMMVSRSIL